MTTQQIKATQLVWTNLNGGLWSAPANWSPNVVPGAADNAVITNAGNYTVTNNATVTVNGLTLGDTNSAGTPRLLITAGTFTVTNTTAASNSVIFLSAGTIVSAGPATIGGTFNQASGVWQLKAPASVNAYNLTNGELRGGTLTVTNFNWMAGNLNADTNGDKTIIPTNGVLNLSSTATRYLSYYSPATIGRGLDNYGTINWTGNALFYSYGTVNNYGSVNVSAVGTPQYLYPGAAPNPIWNNYGTFTRSAGTFFYFQGAYVNNYGVMDIQQGTFSIYTSVFNNNGSLTVTNATLQAYGSTCTNFASITLDAASFFTVDNSGTFTLEANSSLGVPGNNHWVLNAGNVYLRTLNLATPSVWIAGATFWQQVGNTIPTINESAGVWRLSAPTTLSTYNLTNGELRGGTLTVTNFNWMAGNLNADTNGDKTIIPTNGVLTLSTTATRYLSYYSPATVGRGLDNYGTINWTGNALFYSYGTVNNYGAVNVSAVGTPEYLYAAAPNPIWNNYGTFTRSAGTFFYFQSAYVNNYGLMDAQQGTLSFYTSAFNNNGLITVTNATLQAYASTCTNFASITLDATSFFTVDNSGTFTLETNSLLTVPGNNHLILNAGNVYLRTTNLVTPSIWIAGATLWQQTNNVITTINESSGVWRLAGSHALNTYNYTNGELRGGTLTVTNLNWMGGNMNADANGDKTIIPTNGVLNLSTTTTRYLSYYSPATIGRGLDNYGTINWTGNALLYSYGTVNNYGTTTVSATGTPEYLYTGAAPNPIWNNYGTFTRSAGTFFYFYGAYVNNYGAMNAQQGTLSFHTTAFNNNGLLTVTNATLQAYASTCTNFASIALDASSFFTVDNSGTFTLETNSALVVPTYNHLILNAGSVYLRTTNIITPSVWVAGGGLYFQTNNVFATVNMSLGGIQMDVPITLNQLNQTNGNVQGRNLTVTNWTWIDGYHYRGTPGINTNDDRTIIPPGGVMNFPGAASRYLSYYSGVGPSRTLDNYGTINWSGAAILYSYGLLNNYDTVNVSGTGTAQYAAANGSIPPTWNNYGTFTRSAGTLFYFNTCYLNNAGLMDIQQGTLSIYASTFTNTTGTVNIGASSLFQSENSSAITLGAASRITAPTADSIRLGGASAAIETTNIVSPTLWLQAGTLYQRTNIVVATLNESGGALQMDVPCALNQLNQTNGAVQGRNLTVTNWTWIDGYHYRGTPGINTNDDHTIIPPGGVMNFPGAASRYLSYYSGVGPSRTLDNYGTINWTGSGILASYGLLNNYGAVNVSGTGTAQYAAANGSIPPTWNNYGTFTRSAGTLFYFNTCYLNNSGTMDIQQGTLSIYGSTFTNTTGTVNIGASSLFQSENSSAITLSAASRITAPTADSIRLGGASAAIETTNIVSPTLWLQAGTLYQRTNIVISTLNESGGSLQLDTPCYLNQFNQTNGDVQGRNLTITNWNWYAGNHYRGTPGINTNDDRTIIPAGGTMNLLTTTARYLTYYSGVSPSRTLDNYGTINWTGNAVLYSYGVLNNYGSVTVSATGQPQYAAYNGSIPPTWNNYGTFTRSAGTLFYFNTCYLNNAGLMDIQQGTLSIYGSTFTNTTGTVNIGASALFQSENGSTVALNGPSQITAPTSDSIRLGGASAAIETTNIISPTLWLQAGTLYQRTNIVVSTFNESGGSLQLDTPCYLGQFNQTNGDVQGRNLTITNWNWYAGNHYRGTPGINTNDDRTIIPAGGTMNLLTTTARYLTYYSGVSPSRTLDNYGTINWTGNAVLYSYGVLNNYGSVTVSAVGAPQYAAYNGSIPPTWNNYGTFIRSAGTLFYFSTCYLNNAGLMDIQQGTLSIYGSTFTNLIGGTILAQPGAVLANDNSSTSTYEAGSSLGCASTNAFQINSGTVTLRTTAITAPTLWINGGTLNQNTNIAVPVVNESAGTWRLNVPASIATYNLTNGELRGANLAINTFNWLGGGLNSDGPGSNLVTVASSLNIIGATAKSMSYYTAPGRTVINNGNAIWGGGSMTFSGQSSFVNNGNWNVTNDVALGWTGTGAAAPLFQNNGTFTKSAGTGILTLGSTTFTNSGTVAINSGGLTVGGPFVQTAGSAFLGTNFIASSSVSIQSGSLTGKGSVAGAFYNNGAVNPGASPGFINGATYTNTSAATCNIEIGGNTGAGTNFDQMRFSGPVTLDGTLNVSLYNNYALILSNRFIVLTTSARTGTFANVIPPPGATLNTIYNPTNVILEVIGLTNAPLQILTNPVSQTIWTPDPVTFSAAVSGVTPITFQWLFNSNTIPNATNNSYTIPAVAVTNGGLYTLMITDGNGGTTNTSATLTVIPFANTIWWTNIAGGNWSVPANWMPNRIPNGTNNVVIVSNGTYTVTVDVPAALSNLTVGATGATGTPTVHLVSGQSLNVNGNTTWETNTVLALNGLWQMAGGSNNVRGHIDWQLGTLSGTGRTVIATNASLTFIGSLNQKFIITNVLENYGTFNYGNDSFGNAQALRFGGGAQLTNYASGIINIGTAAYDYFGVQTPRSYLVNYGTINTTSGGIYSPSYISIDFVNYGLLDNFGYAYLGRGTNYGTFHEYNALTEISIFGDPGTGEYFSFEPGTVISGPRPNIACGGPVQWKAGNTVHPGRLYVGSGTGGANYANAEFKVLANYTNTYQVLIYRGGFTVANPGLITDLSNFADGAMNAWSFVITNAGAMYADNFSHAACSFGNSGTLLVRSNLTLAGSSYTYGSGTISITNNASATCSGGTVETQKILNRGTNSVTGGMAFTGGAFYRNYAGARTYFGGGSFVTGPASVLNEGLLDGFGGLTINVTNRASVLADDASGRNLALGNYVQESGLTALTPGSASGELNILGGVLTGAGTITGNVRNAATVVPGQPFGLLSITGNYTNTALGTYFLPINGAVAVTNFPQTRVLGTSVLAGTLFVNFTNGFNPVAGNLFTAMVFTARSGVFDAIVNDTYGLDAFYTPTSLVLRAENLLPNVTISVIGDTNQLVCRPFKFKATATDPDGTVTNFILELNGNTVANSTGSALASTAESDSPMQVSVVAQATDNRGGVRTVTQLVNVLNYSATNVLFLGGVRTNDFKLCFVGEPGRNYDVYASTNLTTTNWVNIGPMTVSNGTWRYIDPLTVTNRPYRFYRTQQLP